MNSNTLPEIKSAWNRCLIEVCINAYEESLTHFKNTFQNEMNTSNIHSMPQYQKNAMKYKNECLEEFNLSVRSASGNNQVTIYRKKLIDSIDEYQEMFLNDLIRKSKE